MIFLLVSGFCSHIDQNCIAFKTKHGEPNMTKHAHPVKGFQFTSSLRSCDIEWTTPLSLRNLGAHETDHREKAYHSHTQSYHDKVREKGVSSNPGHGQGQECEDNYVHLLVTTVVNISADDKVNLLCDEVEVTDTTTQLHDPDGNIGYEFALPAKDKEANFRIGVGLRIGFS